ncbi:hypothetical protein [Antrihabitans stalactiti]|uniref:Uncharacterized protein n=1 Tax=Antrihabitans stalactiti TaxID=2584121 RepID=A0A848KUA9_9NOCA|nr:hypothetical protein [Antrihabitans stalactiti]NMN99117.1 hypothetical protein [Antrihabitans stalactiti]
MATGLGLRIGTYESVAAVVTTGQESEPEYIVRKTVLHLTDDGDSYLGEAPADVETHSVSEFLARVGNPEGIVVDEGAGYRAEDLVATAMFCLINLASPNLTPPTEIYATYPEQWNTEAVDALRDALDYLGLRSLNIISEADVTVHAGEEPAHGAALVALAAASDVADTADATEEFSAVATPISGPMVFAPAYSALAEPVGAPLPSTEEPAVESDEEAVGATAIAVPLPWYRRTPVLAAAGVAAFLALGIGAAASLLQSPEKTEVPAIQNAESPAPPPPVLTTDTPVNLPTVTTTVPVEEPKPVVVPVQPVAETTPPPPPPPPPATTTTETTTVPTTPPVTTTVPPTSTPTTVPTTVPPTTVPTTTTPAFGYLPDYPPYYVPPQNPAIPALPFNNYGGYVNPPAHTGGIQQP